MVGLTNLPRHSRGFICQLIFIWILLHSSQASWWYLALVGVSDNLPPPQQYRGGQNLQHRSPSSSLEERCNSLKFLNPAQKRFCSQSADIPGIVARGIHMGVEECKHQFKHRKYNCTTFKDTSIFGKVLEIHGREKAFIYSISSAGVMLSITKACASGQLEICGCDRSKIGTPGVQSRHRTPRAIPSSALAPDTASTRFQNAKSWADIAAKPSNLDRDEDEMFGLPTENTTWQWGGCSHDVKYGSRFTRRFIDSMEDKISPEGLMNLWNNRAGRRAVKRVMQRVCKCHGVSGACTIQVCWRVVPDVREVGDILLAHYDGATKMQAQVKNEHGENNRRKRGKKGRQAPKSLRLTTFHLNVKRPTRNDLVYLADSPDYCYQNAHYGSLGTRGRECLMDNGVSPVGSSGMSQAGSSALQLRAIVGSCKVMCCDRSHYTVTEDVVEDCDCKFQWCCRVVCKSCQRKVVRNYCH